MATKVIAPKWVCAYTRKEFDLLQPDVHAKIAAHMEEVKLKMAADELAKKEAKIIRTISQTYTKALVRCDSVQGLAELMARTINENAKQLGVKGDWTPEFAQVVYDPKSVAGNTLRYISDSIIRHGMMPAISRYGYQTRNVATYPLIEVVNAKVLPKSAQKVLGIESLNKTKAHDRLYESFLSTHARSALYLWLSNPVLPWHQAVIVTQFGKSKLLKDRPAMRDHMQQFPEYKEAVAKLNVMMTELSTLKKAVTAQHSIVKGIIDGNVRFQPKNFMTIHVNDIKGYK